MSTPPVLHVLACRLSEVRIGLPATVVQVIVRAVLIEQVAGAPAIIEGAINLRGATVPVIDVRARLGLPREELSPAQFLVIVASAGRTVAIRVDDVDDLIEVQAADIEAPHALSPTLARVAGVAPLPDGTLVIYDVDTFLTAAERDALEQAMVEG